MTPPRRTGILFVVSAPSGTGKSTLCNNARASHSFRFSVSCTTRPMRPGEEHGRDYWFLAPEEFAAKADAGEFLEHASVHGHRYGTLRANTLDVLDQGVDMLLDIDVQGAAQIRACQDPRVKRCLVDIFVMPPTLEELERRLRHRGTETEENIVRRLGAARSEMSCQSDYAYTIISGTMEEDLCNFLSIIRAEACRSARLNIPQL